MNKYPQVDSALLQGQEMIIFDYWMIMVGSSGEIQVVIHIIHFFLFTGEDKSN